MRVGLIAQQHYLLVQLAVFSLDRVILGAKLLKLNLDSVHLSNGRPQAHFALQVGNLRIFAFHVAAKVIQLPEHVLEILRVLLEVPLQLLVDFLEIPDAL